MRSPLGSLSRFLGASPTPSRRSVLTGRGRHFPHWPDPNRHPPAPGDTGLTFPRSLCISSAAGLVAGTELGSCWTPAPAAVRKSQTGPALGSSLKDVRIRTEFLSLALGSRGGGGEKKKQGRRKRFGPHQTPSASSGLGKEGTRAGPCFRALPLWQDPRPPCLLRENDPKETDKFCSGRQTLTSEVHPELWRLRRGRRMRLAFQQRVDAVTMWKRRSDSVEWWWPPGKGSVVNTLEPRRSGIALPF